MTSKKDEKMIASIQKHLAKIDAKNMSRAQFGTITTELAGKLVFVSTGILFNDLIIHESMPKSQIIRTIDELRKVANILERQL